jgi:hypothetical protein
MLPHGFVGIVVIVAEPYVPSQLQSVFGDLFKWYRVGAPLLIVGGILGLESRRNQGPTALTDNRTALKVAPTLARAYLESL